MKILFLDDDENRHSYAAKELIGHDVHHVRTAEEALKKLGAESFDVAMLDHDLGGTHHAPSNEVSGFSVAAGIGSRAKWLNIPTRVVVHSYNPAGAANMVAALSNGDVPCVWAPFGPTAFAVALATPTKCSNCGGVGYCTLASCRPDDYEAGCV